MKIFTKNRFFSLLLILCVLGPVSSKAQNKTKSVPDLHFGMFICWSLSTFSDKEWTRGVNDISFFNPSGADTDQWCRVAKEAGMDYILFLTKHHDGFCLWDTKTTNWKVTNSPLKKDVLASLKKSCDKYGLKLALYFSEADWTWIPKDLKPKDFIKEERYWEMGRNSELKKAQLKELCTQYGSIAYFWMDHAQSDGGLSHAATVAWVKQFQPNCMVGFNHGEAAGDIRLGEMGKPGPLESAEAGGPYNKIVHKDFKKAEFTYPILGTGGRWFYTNPTNDTVCRTAEELYEDYKGAIKYDNSFALDVGPGRDGKLRDIDVKTLIKVGEMIKKAK